MARIHPQSPSLLWKVTMPYIIYVPGVLQPYITNDPRIYMDCSKIFEWECESRPFCDAFCKAFRQDEDAQFLSERRRGQLEAYWIEELERRIKLNKGLDPLKEGKPLSTEAAVEHLAEHDIDKSVLPEIKDREEGAL
ncbi:uncharacterized protein J4E78_000091 [Alternaria triticimaculans]|uniref:uncharacterized protein n=1 Tax=Alternaria triticimaculans TaxID=297637 RepID=UPI0020C55939|nr:uncharacterized protein J4E78_000091 [Alternaria triticimaculans]KAI4671595.1 hypothetical protein J4E78_000091 [Alternaria triticimaculans]